MKKAYKDYFKQIKKMALVGICISYSSIVFSQDTLVKAGPQYGTSSFHQWKWGKHYRKEWVTPVRVPFLNLDTIGGGLIPYEAGGGRQSKSLRLRNGQGKEYVLRSIDKSFSGALPEIFQNTFIESISNDQVSIANPYAALTVPIMANAAGIYHAIPIIRFLPKQQALDTFNNNFGNTLFLLEQRPDGNWEEAANYGNAKNIISTEKLLENIKEDNDDRVDQLWYVRSRLFDIFLGDWGRHEDQWRWAVFENDKKKTYRPIPRDRDQAYTKLDGWLLKTLLSAGGLGHLQSFDHNIKDIARFNFPARNLDRQMANAVSLQQWTDIAKELQQVLTDAVIEKSIKELPPEVFSISGNEIISKLKSHRDQLVTFASDYYRSLAKEVDITGTQKNEYVEVKRLDDNETSVKLFKITKEGETKKEPFYSRVFNKNETDEIRLYGIDGTDKYFISGNVNDGIKVRIIGGIGKDSIIDESNVSGGRKTIVYDNPGNYIQASSETKYHLSKDTAINAFKYDAFKYGKRGITPIIFFSYADRVFAGLNYKIKKQTWRKQPYGSQHNFIARYSIQQAAPNFLYSGIVNQFIGNWNLSLNAHYDLVRWTNFYGIGNEAKLLTPDRDFYRMRTRDLFADVGLNQFIGKYQSVSFSGFFQGFKILSDTDRFVRKFFRPVDKELLQQKNFAGATVNYVFEKGNDPLLPTKGIGFKANATYTKNLKENRSVTAYGGEFHFHVPLLKNLVLSVKTGGASLNGTPEFYQYNSIGGSNSLRGYRRDRFWGKSVLYNNNELQWFFNVKSHLFNGKFGFVGVFDEGRVWLPNEASNTWHTGYGGGILLVPFDKIFVSVTFAQSKDFRLIHLKYRAPLKR